jgi:sulfocyanin SoxE-like protein
MSRSRFTRSMSLLVTAIVAGIGGAGCSKGADRPPSLETAASSVTTQRASDSAEPVRDSGASLSARDTPPAKPMIHPVTKRPARDSVPRGSIEPATPAAEAAPDKGLSYDPATNTVTFELIAGPFTFNGHRNGDGTLVVPSKANMVINFVNKDGTPHSAIVTPGDGPVPNSATDPAIPRAYTNKVLEGLPQEGSDVMRFPVPESGTYRILCGVPGHALSGMWIWLKVDPAAKAPSFGPTKG